MVARWLLALPVMVAATVLPTLGTLAISVWWAIGAHEVYATLPWAEPPPTFWSEVGGDPASRGTALLVPAAALLGTLAVWLLTRPVATDLARARIDIPYLVPGTSQRLRVLPGELRLDHLGTRTKEAMAEGLAAAITLRANQHRQVQQIE